MLRSKVIRSGVGRRPGFTLIELLIVITIIAILASMGLGAYWRVLQRAKETRASAEISELATALTNFEQRFGAMPPSSLQMPPSPGTASYRFWKKCFPYAQVESLPWGVSGTLSGDQVLVFCLGGMQAGSDKQGICQGFSTNPKNPCQASGDRIRPMYEFQSNRLVRLKGNGFSYLDPFDTNVPYVYFASDKGNDYPNTQFSATNANGQGSTVSPYYSSSAPLNYYKPDGFQIISAGVDGQFGPGGYWLSSQAETWNGYMLGQPGADDLCNFYASKLGIGNQ